MGGGSLEKGTEDHGGEEWSISSCVMADLGYQLDQRSTETIASGHALCVIFLMGSYELRILTLSIGHTFGNSPQEAHRNKRHEMEALAFCLLAITLPGKFIFCVAEALLLWGIYQRYCAEVFVRWPETTLDVWNISDRICQPNNKITSFLSCYCTYIKNTKTSWHNF